MIRDNDIKAPDGYLLGGLRRVRKDGTVLFQRGWWKVPDEWIGEKVWVHEACPDRFSHADFNVSAIGVTMLEVAPPDRPFYSAQRAGETVLCDRTERPDAKPTFRRPSTKAWLARQ